ncbi:hypothetical protein EDB86DRAFT_2824500 [Lactarius hatsudake]|nr:hypothetical protein EDB86DRAFT_2824500 [Lactarius hatsudake]
MECEGWEVRSGGRKQSCTLQRGVKIWIRLRRGLECVWFDSLRPRASAARRGMQWSLSLSGKCSKLRIGVRVLEPIPVRRNDRQKPNGCNNAVDWVDIANSKLLLAANTESNSTDSAALERLSLPKCAYATAAGQLMLPCSFSSPTPFVPHITNKMPYKIATWILGVVVFVGIGQYLVGPVEAWMRNANVWIAIGFNTTVQLYWDGGLIEHNLAPFRFVIPCDQVMPAA